MLAAGLRPATTADAAFERRVFIESRPELAFLPEHVMSQQFAAQCAQHGDAERWVITWDGDPVGRVLVRESAAELRIIDIAVLTSHRGRGIGSHVLAHLCRRADSASVPIALSVRPENTGARALYARCGFVEHAASDTLIELIRELA